MSVTLTQSPSTHSALLSCALSCALSIDKFTFNSFKLSLTILRSPHTHALSLLIISCQPIISTFNFIRFAKICMYVCVSVRMHWLLDDSSRSNGNDLETVTKPTTATIAITTMERLDNHLTFDWATHLTLFSLFAPLSPPGHFISHLHLKTRSSWPVELFAFAQADGDREGRGREECAAAATAFEWGGRRVSE